MPTRRALIQRAAAALVLIVGAACQRGSERPPLRLIVGFTAGGPYDLHARLLAQVLGRHLPGHPAIVVENIPGAASGVAAARLAASSPDGSTFALLGETSAPEAVDTNLADRFQFLGSPGAPPYVVVFSKQSGIASLDDWRRAARPPRFGSAGARTPMSIVPLVTSAALSLPIQVVAGYTNAAEIRLAFDGGEVEAVCVTVEAYRSTFQSSPDRRIVLRLSTTPIAGLEVPDALSVATTARARDLLEVGVYAMAGLVRYYAAPRGVPAPRQAELRQAVARSLADPEFLSAATAAGLIIAPLSHDAIEAALRSLSARPATVAELRTILDAR